MAEATARKSLMNTENQLAARQDVLPQDYNKRIKEAKRQNKALMALMNELLEEGIDYGREKGIPKPFLHQPGAQQLMLVFKFTPEFEIINKEIEFNQEPVFISYDVKCKLKQRESGQFLGEGVGSCNNYEEKYKYRWKTDNNGNRYREVYEDPFDNQNTLLKMAKKRAMVDAVLNVTGAARLFTQDQDYVQTNKNYSNSNKKSSNKKSNKVNVNRPEEVVIPSGKHKGKKVGEAPDYFLEWVLDNMEGNDKWAEVYTAAKMHLENKEEQSEEQSNDNKSTWEKVEKQFRNNEGNIELHDREREIKKIIDDNAELKRELYEYLQWVKEERSLEKVGINDLEKTEFEELKDLLNKCKGFSSKTA